MQQTSTLARVIQTTIKPIAYYLGLLGLASPSMAANDTPPQTDSTQLNDIEVIAYPPAAYIGNPIQISGKHAQAWQDIPESVSVMSRQQIEDRQLITVDDALDKVTGIRSKSNDNLVKSYFARGYTMSALYDGIPSYNNMGGHGHFDLPFYETVEVVRGPAGIFRGVGEPGGAVNFVKKRPQKTSATSWHTYWGSWQQLGAEVDITGALNTDGSVRARTMLGHESRHYFYELTRSRKNMALLAFEWDIQPQTTANLSYSWQNHDVKGTHFGLPTYTKNADGIWPLTSLPRKTNLSAPWVKDHFHLREWSAWVQHHFADEGEIKLSLNHREQEQYFKEIFPYESINPTTQTLTLSTLQGLGHTYRTGIDLYAAIPFRAWQQPHQWLIGAHHDLVRNRTERGWGPDYDDIRWDDLSALQTEPSINANRGNESRTRQYGAYTQLKLHLSDPLAITLGGRYSGFQEKNRSIAPSPTSDWRLGRTTHAHITPYASAMYRWRPDWSLYASYSGIYSPQLQEKYDGSVLKPREGRQFEIGTKKQWADGQFNTSLAYFNIRDRNRAYVDTAHSSPSMWYYLNAGQVESQGWEAEASGSPYPGWDMSAGYTYLKTRYLRDSNASRENNVFDFYTPRHTLKLYAQYRFHDHHPWHGLSLGMGVRSQSKTPARTHQRPLLINPGYTVVDASLQYRINRNHTIALNINNLFDKHYYRHVGSSYMGNFYGEPRNVLLSIRGRY